MAKDKKTFIFYTDWNKLISAMPSDKAGDLVKLMLSYVNDEDPDEPKDPFIIMAWAHIKPMLKSDLKDWEDKKTKFSDMGKKSAAKRKATQVERKSAHVEHTLTVNDNVNVNVNDTVNDNINVNLKESNKNSYAIPSLDDDILLNTFNVWWNIYDKKVDMSKCKKKFLKLSRDEMRKAIEHSEEYILAQPDKQYRRNPITYLNNKNFNDDELLRRKQSEGERVKQTAQDTIERINYLASQLPDN